MLWFVSGVNGNPGTFWTKQILQTALERKTKKTNSPSLLYYLDEFDRYISNLFLGIAYQLRDQQKTLRLSVKNRSLEYLRDAMDITIPVSWYIISEMSAVTFFSFINFVFSHL